MRKLAPALVLILGLTGCATAAPGAAGPASAPTAASPTGSAGCPQLLNLNQTDTGTKCVGLGGSVIVQLGGLAGQEWTKPQLSAAGILRSVPTSALVPSHTTFDSYQAVGAGTVDITSSRSACPPPSPGSAGCHAQQGWRITVTVR
jgi:hypothetical protein